MIRRRLIIVNIVILTLTLGLATLFETRALRDLLYRENTVSYNNRITAAYDSLKGIFEKGEDDLLIVCANRPLQNVIKSSVPDKNELDETLASLKQIMGVEDITVLPVRGYDVYERGRYQCRY